MKIFIQKKRHSLLNQKTQLEGELKHLPEGDIHFAKNLNRYKWRRTIHLQDGSTKTTTLSKKEVETAQLLARKKYVQDQINNISRQIDAIDDFVLRYPDDIHFPEYCAPLCPDYGELLRPSFAEELTRKDSWIQEDYDKNPDFPEYLKVPTKAGLFVRSKSEAIIANALYDKEIPFRYDCALSLGGIKIYPDFTILHPRNLRDIVIWEHFGMMGNGNYAHTCSVKLEAYMSNGYIPGVNLITTYETKERPIDINFVDLLIDYYFG